jgi:hypothetical protein
LATPTIDNGGASSLDCLVSAMAETVADFMLSRLSEWGVRRIYGYPGDGI